MHRHLEGEGRLEDDVHRAEVTEQAQTALKNQILLDTLAEQLEVGVNQKELLEYLVSASRQYGMDPNAPTRAIRRRVRVHAVLARRVHQVVEQLVLADLISSCSASVSRRIWLRSAVVRLLAHLGAVLVVLEPTLALEVTVHLGLDDTRRDRDLVPASSCWSRRSRACTAWFDALVRDACSRRSAVSSSSVSNSLASCAKSSSASGSSTLLDGRGGDRHQGGLARVVAAREGRLERGRLAGRQARQRLVETLEHVARADLVADAGDVVDLLVADGRGEVDDDEVALGGRAVDPTSVPKRSRRASRRPWTSSSETSTSSTVTAMPSSAGTVISGRTSTSAVKCSSPSSPAPAVRPGTL